MIACDLVVANQQEPLQTLKSDSRVVASVDVMPTAELVLNPDQDVNAALMLQRIRARVGRERTDAVAFRGWSEQLTGSNVGANIMQLGYAWQRGLVPVSRAALERAIELNDVAVEANQQIFTIGRLLAESPDQLRDWIGSIPTPSDIEHAHDLQTTVARCIDYLTEYQDARYAERYRLYVGELADEVNKHVVHGEKLVKAVAENLFKLMAYKDEYEVARLHSNPQFLRLISEQFEGDYRLKFNLAPPILARKNPANQRPLKRQFGEWVLPLFRGLAAFKGLRGSIFDPFGYTAERRLERHLIEDYRNIIAQLIPALRDDNFELAVEIASLPTGIRGYGHIKLQSIREARQQQTELLQRYAAMQRLPNAA